MPLETISDKLIRDISSRLAQNQRVRKSLPIWGRVHIERQLPFLCVYRKPLKRPDVGTEGIVKGEASYLMIAGNRQLYDGVQKLVVEIVKAMEPHYGAFLIVEIWTAINRITDESAPAYKPAFRIHAPKNAKLASTVDVFAKSLATIKIRDQRADVQTVSTSKIKPPRLPLLFSSRSLLKLDCYSIGLEIQPVHTDETSGEAFPLILKVLHRKLATAFKRCFFEFTRTQTTQRPPHYLALGRRSMVKAVWEVDDRLAEIGDSFDFLLQVSPINGDSAWASFKRKHFDATPDFIYRRLPIDPLLAKRRLYNIPIENIEDPTLTQLFRDQQAEYDKKLTMLVDLQTPRFLYGSMQLFGVVDAPLMDQATAILTKLGPRSRDKASGEVIDSAAFVALAEEEIRYLRQNYPEMNATVNISDDIMGLMVSQGNVFVNRRFKVPMSRASALLQHEIGTHVLTYWNGRAQRLKQLHIGLTGYDELQEGLAVFAEYLSGGLSRPRLRLLAGRVVAANRMIEGATFIDVFRELNHTYEFQQRTAFNITLRVFRGGGLTKDAVYLSGLIKLLRYLEKNGDFEILFVGKFNTNHIPIIKELRWRKVLVGPPLKPRYIELPTVQERLQLSRNGLTVLDLLKRTEN